jgi:hypothetical protein
MMNNGIRWVVAMTDAEYRVKGVGGRRWHKTVSRGEAGVPRVYVCRKSGTNGSSGTMAATCDNGAMATTHNKEANWAMVNKNQDFRYRNMHRKIEEYC